MTTKKSGVNCGMTFFYQSWNHRKSTLPVNTEYWQKGYVTYPNAEDRSASLASRAGHAIHLIGWDDNLEVQMRDKDGNLLENADGSPKMEKGFFLFKNSWGTAGFGINHPTGPGYGWISYKYINEQGSCVTAEVPTLASRPIRAPARRVRLVDHRRRDPDKNATGSTSAIKVRIRPGSGAVKVTVDITHTYSGDLVVALVKGTDRKVLSANVGGSVDDIKKTFTVTGLDGKALAGEWQLSVVDSAAIDTGTLNSWKIELTSRN